MNNVIFDLDDFAFQKERNCLNDLINIKEQFPKFKCTLFAIPFYGDKDQSWFFEYVNDRYGKWIQLAIHGWKHDSNFECMKWTYNEAEEYIQKAVDMKVFVDGFKAPGWQISRDTYKVLNDMGLWVADHKTSAYTENGVLNVDRRPKELRCYEIDHPWMIHGHTWECSNNGIKQLINEGFKWDQNTEFHFIDDIV